MSERISICHSLAVQNTCCNVANPPFQKKNELEMLALKEQMTENSEKRNNSTFDKNF
jgi:hypothetical protein